jgi:Vps16, C-terminal region
VLIHSCSVYHVLLQLYKRLRLGDFFRLIEDGGSSLAPASRLLQVYAREQNPEMLRDFYYSDDRRVESAVLNLEEARRMKASNQLFFLVCDSTKPMSCLRTLLRRSHRSKPHRSSSRRIKSDRLRPRLVFCLMVETWHALHRDRRVAVLTHDFF